MIERHELRLALESVFDDASHLNMHKRMIDNLRDDVARWRKLALDLGARGTITPAIWEDAISVRVSISRLALAHVDRRMVVEHAVDRLRRKLLVEARA